MTITATEPILATVARWMVRLEAAGSVLRMSFLGVTAASTLTSALALIGLEQFAPFVLLSGVAGTLIFAYLYVEAGVYNRKNREKNDRGTNFAGPTLRIDDEMLARAIKASQLDRPLTDDERNAIKTELDDAYDEFREGIPLDT